VIITTGNEINGHKITELGIVRGNVVQARHIGRDIMAGFKNIAGGEIKSYTELTNSARDIAYTRMVAEAKELGADGVIAMRFSSSSISDGTIEMLCYGTAVKFRK
jgi:uncharacterized protein YbjQ (UPF0145 family)